MKVGSSTRPPASSEVLHATINMAVYNATMAIVGGYQQYGAPIASPRGADVRAAVATAAFLTAAARGWTRPKWDTCKSSTTLT